MSQFQGHAAECDVNVPHLMEGQETKTGRNQESNYNYRMPTNWLLLIEHVVSFWKDCSLKNSLHILGNRYTNYEHVVHILKSNNLGSNFTSRYKHKMINLS